MTLDTCLDEKDFKNNSAGTKYFPLPERLGACRDSNRDVARSRNLIWG
jgi:hypothetical protein